MRRTAIELIHLAISLIVTASIAQLSSWSYPIASSTIWWVALGAGVIVVLMAVGPVRQAWAADRERRR